MAISTSTQNLVITNVSRIPIEFYVGDLNIILEARDGGLYPYTSRNKINFS